MPLILFNFILEILNNLKNCRNIVCLFILHKILYNFDQPLHYKLPEFAMPIHITRHTFQQSDKAFLLPRYNTHKFSWHFTCFITHLWNILPNEAFLAVKQDCFTVLVFAHVPIPSFPMVKSIYGALSLVCKTLRFSIFFSHRQHCFIQGSLGYSFCFSYM